jgi:hypothetical protein
MSAEKINTQDAEFKMIVNKKDEPDYKAVSKFVGGMVECVTFPNGDLLLLNEEGKLMGLPLNDYGEHTSQKKLMHSVTMTLLLDL